jgi:hypothetical protein
VSKILENVSKAAYFLPERLSFEVKDLISSLLQVVSAKQFLSTVLLIPRRTSEGPHSSYPLAQNTFTSFL